MVVLNLLHRLPAVAGLQQLVLVQIVMEHLHQYLAVNFFVVNDQYLLLLHFVTIQLCPFATKS